ncbi:thiamine-phosphate kinase [Thalassotalea sp. HSM 43]|uniref:thiamine-phosphate kinase n=1 Tax=Thalassotalea sp. HSM 43 TaxID=2552945 RepID=UPI001081411C|nr:thiamine-phosphate kinase [Thalassotalea sp. HSM 43]QBY03380.1 thiamine-phosphate kinase [Thalassotalea sp. HSM 43]
MKEFELIKQFFTAQPVNRKDVAMGIGDDCALIEASGDSLIAVTTDTLVAGVHFPLDTSARAIGHKAVAVNLSDLAAMGAVPSWISVAITLPEVDEKWLAEFTQGMFELTEYYNVQLIGGDTTQGPLSITITAQGTVARNTALCRSGAKNGDYVFVTNTIGDAGLALAAINGQVELSEQDFVKVKEKLDFPRPQVLVAQMIREFATAAIDVSDGLLADLEHLCKASTLGIDIDLANVPISDVMLSNLSKKQAITMALTSGDDYQLIFTVPATNKVGVETAMAHANVDYRCLGQLNPSQQINLLLDGENFVVPSNGFQHFS